MPADIDLGASELRVIANGIASQPLSVFVDGWYYNKTVDATFANYTTQWAWAYIHDYGWARIKDGAADGVTNLFIMMNEAKGDGRLVHVFIDHGLITTACLV